MSDTIVYNEAFNAIRVTFIHADLATAMKTAWEWLCVHPDYPVLASNSFQREDKWLYRVILENVISVTLPKSDLKRPMSLDTNESSIPDTIILEN